MRWLALMLTVSACTAQGTPPDMVYVVKLCVVGCPLVITVAEGQSTVTDVAPLEPPHFKTDNIRILSDRNAQ